MTLDPDAILAVVAEDEAKSPATPTAPRVNTVRPYTTCWTDGSSTGKVGPGGWAWCVSEDDNSPYAGWENSGGDPSTTNQRMELLAAWEAMKAIDGLLLILSDSEYVVKGFTTWQTGWRAKEWRKVMNTDLWIPAVETYLARSGEVKFHWVKGHAGYPGNERADQLAKAAKARVADVALPGLG